MCSLAKSLLASVYLGLAGLSILENDEKTRCFLSCEVGFGYAEVSFLQADPQQVRRTGLNNIRHSLVI